MPETSRNPHLRHIQDVDLRHWVEFLQGPFGREMLRYATERVQQIAVKCLRDSKTTPEVFYQERGRVNGILEFKGFLDGLIREYKLRLESNAPSKEGNSKPLK